MAQPIWTIRRVRAVDAATISGLTDVLLDVVDGGASVGFMWPFTHDRAEAFWLRVADGVAAGGRVLLVAEDEQGVCGTVHLVLDLPENQPHRADLVKMLVHRRARRQGLGAALMRAAESTARELGLAVLVLDAVTGGDASRLYESLGWQRVGSVPNFALFPDGRVCATTYYYKNVNDDTIAGSSLRTCEDALRRAQLTSDVEALDRLVDESLVFTGPDGAIYAKGDDLDAHRHGWIRINRLEPRDERIQDFGEIAVISVRMEMSGTFRDTPFNGPFRYTRVWRRFANGWRIVSGHVSSVAG